MNDKDNANDEPIQFKAFGHSPARFAILADVPLSTVYEWLTLGELSAKRSGRRIIITPESGKKRVNDLPDYVPTTRKKRTT